VGGLENLIAKDHPDELKAWQDRTNQSLSSLTSSSSDDDVRAAIAKIADDYVSTFGKLQDLQPAIGQVADAMKDFTEQKGNVIAKIESSPIVSIEYTNTRQSATTALPQSLATTTTVASPLPDLSNINFIGGLPFIGRSQFTFNAGTIFSTLFLRAATLAR